MATAATPEQEDAVARAGWLARIKASHLRPVFAKIPPKDVPNQADADSLARLFIEKLGIGTPGPVVDRLVARGTPDEVAKRLVGLGVFAAWLGETPKVVPDAAADDDHGAADDDDVPVAESPARAATATAIADTAADKQDANSTQVDTAGEINEAELEASLEAQLEAELEAELQAEEEALAELAAEAAAEVQEEDEDEKIMALAAASTSVAASATAFMRTQVVPESKWQEAIRRATEAELLVKSLRGELAMYKREAAANSRSKRWTQTVKLALTHNAAEKTKEQYQKTAGVKAKRMMMKRAHSSRRLEARLAEKRKKALAGANGSSNNNKVAVGVASPSSSTIENEDDVARKCWLKRIDVAHSSIIFAKLPPQDQPTMAAAAQMARLFSDKLGFANPGPLVGRLVARGGSGTMVELSVFNAWLSEATPAKKRSEASSSKTGSQADKMEATAGVKAGVSTKAATGVSSAAATSEEEDIFSDDADAAALDAADAAVRAVWLSKIKPEQVPVFWTKIPPKDNPKLASADKLERLTIRMGVDDPGHVMDRLIAVGGPEDDHDNIALEVFQAWLQGRITFSHE